MKRKEFLKSVGLASAGVAVASTSAFGQSADKKAMNLDGKTAFITGAARGIGLGIAVDLAKQGTNIALLDIADPTGGMAIKNYRLANEEELNDATSQIKKLGVKAIKIKADARDLGCHEKSC